MKKRMRILLSLAVVLTLFAACAGIEIPGLTQEEVRLTKLTLTKTVTNYKLGDAVDLTDTVTTESFSDGTEKEVLYADLQENGLTMTLYFDGEAFTDSTFTKDGTYLLAVYATDNEAVFASLEVSATETGEVYPTNITITANASLTVGDTTKLKVTFEPSTVTIRTVSWASDNEAVASVDEDGLITAIGEGNAVITASAEAADGTVSGTCAVTVGKAGASAQTPQDQTGTFRITTEDGAFTQSGSVYTITSGGTYDLSGSLEGRIVVSAGEEDAVVLNLNGVTISSGENSPILALKADNVTVHVSDDTENTIYDTRAAKKTDAEDQGEGVISAKCDLYLTGFGKLYAQGNYNNGVHTTDDLKITDVTLTVQAVNNALKGKDSLTIMGGTLTVISTGGDGVKTENTDVSSKGKQRGAVVINGGSTTVYAAGDGVQAAYDFEMNGGTLTIYTASNSSYTSSSANVSSYKGVKVQNELIVNNGTLNIYSYDDGLHADYGTKFENGETGKGIITINGGSITTKVNSSSSRYVTGADAIHADNTLNINGGTVNVASAYEGLEANYVNISGGDIVIRASDDGINAAKKINQTPSVTISGGNVDITMASGDTDGIDSNGSFTMTGGFVIVRGAPNSNSSMATGLDCDGTAKLTGGTFIQLGARETVPTLGSGCYTLNYGSTAGGGFGGGPGGRGGFGGFGGFGGSGSGASSSTNTITSGTWTLSGLNVSFTVEDGYSYYGAVVYSSRLTSGASYTLSNGSTSYSATAG